MERQTAHRAVFRFRVRRSHGGEEVRFFPEAILVSGRALYPSTPDRENGGNRAQEQQAAPHLRVVPLPQEESAPAAMARWMLPIVEQILVDGIQLGKELQHKHGRRAQSEERPPAE